MSVNNENGYILPMEKAFSMIKKKYPQVITHCDCVQGFMKITVKAKKLNADMISLSGHKIYAPKGHRCAVCEKGHSYTAFMLGGGQEKGFRSGTESVPLICGFGAAVKKLAPNVSANFEKAADIQAYLIEKCNEKRRCFRKFTKRRLALCHKHCGQWVKVRSASPLS